MAESTNKLAALFGKAQPPKQESQDDKAQAQDAVATGGAESSDGQEAPAASPPPKNPFAALPKSRESTDPNKGDDPKPVGEAKPNGLKGLNFVKPPVTKSSPTPAPAATGLSLDDLAADESEGVAPKQTVAQRIFADETPATAPTRELPEDTPDEAKQFVKTLDGIYEVSNDPELFGSVCKSIMVELKSNPQYMKLLSPEDIRTFIRGMRDNMGLAKITKAEKKSSRGKGKSAKVDADMLADLDDLGIDLDSMA